MGVGALQDSTFFNLCFDTGYVHPHCSDLFFKLVKAGCPASWAVFALDCVVSVVKIREIFISDVHNQITTAAAEDPVDGTAEESRGPICTRDGHRML